MWSGGQECRFTFCDSRFTERDAHVAQLVEHVLGKDEVTRSIRVVGSMQSLLDLQAHEVSAMGKIGYRGTYCCVRKNSVSHGTLLK
jgi:hypothetical protein